MIKDKVLKNAKSIIEPISRRKISRPPLLKRALVDFIPREKRAKLLIVLWGIIILSLVGRLFFLQVVKGSYYAWVSEENRIRPFTLPASRGLIKDRNGKIIADNRPSYTVFIIPYEVLEAFPENGTGGPSVADQFLTPLAKKLASCLKSDVFSLEKKLKSNWSKSYRPIKLKKDVDFNTICVIEEQKEDLPGLIYQVEPTRKYLKAGWVGHVLGYVNELTREELSLGSKKGFRLGGVIGRKGIEKQYDDFLRGKDGVTFLEVTARGKILGQLKERKPDLPVNGADIELTIDADLQAVAESALAEYQSGAVVALDPRNGEILALVSKPGLDANLFVGSMSPEKWEEILKNPLHPLHTRPIQATYPPGSILKLLTAGIALETKLVNRNTILSPCNGFFHYGRERFGCWVPEGHGKLNLVDAIIQSCDVYFYQLGLKVGLERWSRYAKLCGFGQKTGVDLPDEAKGLVPSLEYYHRKYGKGEWVRSLIINLAIGQGEILVTPLQVAVFFAGLVSEGRVHKPHLLKRMISPDGRVTITSPEVIGHLPFSPSTLRILKQAMIGVVNDPRGTGTLAKIQGVTVAGKTGTAQNPHGEDHAWFAGYAPASDPRIVAVVLIENVGHGGSFAAPVAKKIMESYLRKNRTKTQRKTSSQIQPAPS